MATPKTILFDSPSKQKKDGTYPVCLKVTHQRKRKYFSLGRDALPNQWNKETCRFRRNYPNDKKENKALLKREARAEDIIREFELEEIPFSFAQFEIKFLKIEKPNLVKAFFNQCIEQFVEAGKIATASPYKTTLNSILEFAAKANYDSERLKLREVDYKFLTDFEHWLRTSRNCKDTSISVYMRTLRAVFNKAIKEGIVKREYYPFDKYSLSERLKTQTQKRAISIEKIKEIEALEFEQGTKLHLAKSFFLFSYYTRGMNFVDIALLTNTNISGDRLFYIRQKTGKPFNIKLRPEAQNILEYFQQNNEMEGDYIFPIFDTSIHITPEQIYNRRKTALREINRNLKKIAAIVDLEGLKLTSYVSRHSYATNLKQAGGEIAKISEALGHSSEKVTQVYLKAFENSDLDELDELDEKLH